MAKLFSIAAWNVEHFKGEGDDATRVGRVIDFLNAQRPDIFGLFEVEGRTVFQSLVDRMPGYTFQITEGQQTQEILVGVKKKITAFITQRTEFRSGTTRMRPGQLVTVRHANGKDYPILFLHLSSGASPRGMGLRDDMVMKAIDFKKTLDKGAPGGRANYIFLGDLNNMGLLYPFGRDIPNADELRKWDQEAKRAKYRMRRLDKTHINTWSDGSMTTIPNSPLDHVFAARHLQFRAFPKVDGEGSAEVSVRGWVDLPSGPVRDQWIENFSDHALIYLEVHG